MFYYKCSGVIGQTPQNHVSSSPFTQDQAIPHHTIVFYPLSSNDCVVFHELIGLPLEQNPILSAIGAPQFQRRWHKETLDAASRCCFLRMYVDVPLCTLLAIQSRWQPLIQTLFVYSFFLVVCLWGFGPPILCLPYS